MCMFVENSNILGYFYGCPILFCCLHDCAAAESEEDDNRAFAGGNHQRGEDCRCGRTAGDEGGKLEEEECRQGDLFKGAAEDPW